MPSAMSCVGGMGLVRLIITSEPVSPQRRKGAKNAKKIKKIKLHCFISVEKQGLLLNFNVALVRDGIKRIVNGL